MTDTTMKELHDAAGLGDMHIKTDGRRNVVTPGELIVCSMYEITPHTKLDKRAEYFARLHNDYVTGALVERDRPINRFIKALDKPIVQHREDCGVLGYFDPWNDIMQGVHGGYDSQMDGAMIHAMRAVGERKTFEFTRAHPLIGEMCLYMLSGFGYTEYGTSPRGAWPDPKLKDHWQPMINKWVAHYEVVWGFPFDAEYLF